jgi:hypothetical protein
MIAMTTIIAAAINHGGVRGGLHLCLGIAGAGLLRLVGDAGSLSARRVHAGTPRLFGLVGGRACSLGPFQIVADLLLAKVDRRLDLRDHAEADNEEGDPKDHRQPEQL